MSVEEWDIPVDWEEIVARDEERREEKPRGGRLTKEEQKIHDLHKKVLEIRESFEFIRRAEFVVADRQEKPRNPSVGLLGGLLRKFIPGGGGAVTDFLGENIEETLEETLQKLAPIALGLGGWYVAESHVSYTTTVYQKDAEGKDLKDAEGNKIPELDKDGNPVTETIKPPRVLHLLVEIMGLTAAVLEVLVHSLSALIEKDPIDFLRKYTYVPWSPLTKKGGGW